MVRATVIPFTTRPSVQTVILAGWARLVEMSVCMVFQMLMKQNVTAQPPVSMVWDVILNALVMAFVTPVVPESATVTH